MQTLSPDESKALTNLWDVAARVERRIYLVAVNQVYSVIYFFVEFLWILIGC